LKTFDRALGFSLALHVAVVALWQWSDARPTEPPSEASVHDASHPVVVSLTLPEPSPLAAQTTVRPAAAVAPTRRAAPAAETLVTSNVVTTSAATAPVSAVVPATVPAVVATAAPAPEPGILSVPDPIPLLFVKGAVVLRAGSGGDKAGVNANTAVELPSSEADYFHNPKPNYPAMSRRLGEQGRVLVRVFIDASGQPQQAEVKQSSGFERLDQTALNTVLKWRYLPGKRNGTPEAMWLQVPLEFRLE
jgi:protein TonB